jgi:ATP-binding cassette subfamily B protein
MLLKNLRPLFPYLNKYRRGYIWGTLCVFLHNGIWVLFPLVIRRAVNELTQGVTIHKLWVSALLLLAVAATKGIFQFLTRWIVIGVSREIEFDLRNDLFRHLEGLSHSFYQRTRTGDIMARATNDLNAVRMLLGPAIMYSANTLVFTAGALAFMWHISPRLTMYAFLPLPIVSIVIQYFGRRIHERFERIQAMFSDISARAQENFSGVRVIRAYGQEKAEIAGFETSNREYIARSLKLVRLMGMLWPTLETMLGLAVVLVLWLGGREVLYGRINVGDFVAFNTYMVQLTWPIIALGWVINIFQRGTASVLRISELMQEKAEITDSPEALSAPANQELQGDIEFRNLNFSYDGTQVLHDIDLKIPAGVDNGQRMRIQGEGESGLHGGPPGDLDVVFFVKEHEFFERQQNNILCTVPISFTQAALGAEITVPTLDSEEKLKVPEGTQSGKVFCLKGRGLSSPTGRGKGDQFVRVNVVTPTRLSTRGKEFPRKIYQWIRVECNFIVVACPDSSS